MDHLHTTNADPVLPEDTQIASRIDLALTWELVYELREAANMAHGLGRTAQAERLAAWADRLSQILSPDEPDPSEACISQIYVG